jgi:hypothetical protein
MKRREFLGAVGGGGILLSGAGRIFAAAQAGASPTPYYWSWWGWEPQDHYRRTNGIVGAVDVTAPGFPQWYERLHSEDMVRAMSKLGVNLAITHFFKGFGLKHEHAEQQRTAQLVRAAHRHGVRVLGYCQSRSLYYETFLAEEPQAETWIQRDADGKLRTWGSAYFRWAPCIHSREFRDYMKRAIRVGLEEVGLDGLHFDNDYCEPCYCPRCEKAFRDWLTANCRDPRDRFGLASFDTVRQPPTLASAGRIIDPLVQAWVRFRCESLGEYHRDITDYARSLRGDVILLANPAYPRGSDGPYRRSVWAPAVGRHLTLMFAENDNSAGMADGAMISQIRAYKHASAIGYRVVSTTWKRGKGLTGLALPQKSEEITLQVAEAAAFGGIPGTNWALRPDGPGDRMRIDVPELRAALGQYLAFARQTENLRPDTRSIRDVAVLQTFASMVFEAAVAPALVLGAEEVLIRDGFAWETVFGDRMDRLNGFAALVLAGQSHLSDKECSTICDFARRGGGLVLAGDNGTCNEHGRARRQNPLADLAGPQVVRLESTLFPTASGSGRTERVPLSKDHKRIAAAVQKALGSRLSVRLSGADTVALAAYQLADGRLAAHLVNYAAPALPKGLKLSLGGQWKNASRVRLLTAESPEQTLPVNAATVEIPAFSVYAIVIVG